MNQDFKILNHKLVYYGKILMIHFQQYFQNQKKYNKLKKLKKNKIKYHLLVKSIYIYLNIRMKSMISNDDVDEDE